MDKRTYFHRVAASNSATISKKSSNSAEKKYHYKRNYISITRYLFTILIIGIALALTAFRPTYTPSPSYYEPCKIENKTFQGGEIAVYKLYYNLQFVWIPAGEVVFTVKDLGNQYYISARGYTYPSYEWFYKVRDHYESYIDKSTLLPTQAIRTVQEGNYRHYEEVQFNQLAKSVAYIEGKTKDNLRKDTTFELGNCTHDILSLLYFSRNLQFTHLTKGTSFPLTFFMDEKTYPIGVQFEGKEPNKKIKGLGRFNTIRFQPQVVAGQVFNEDTTMDIWVSDDNNRIPLLIESPVSVGSVKAVLKSYDGLRYQMDAAVQ